MRCGVRRIKDEQYRQKAPRSFPDVLKSQPNLPPRKERTRVVWAATLTSFRLHCSFTLSTATEPPPMEFGPQHDPPSRTRQHREVDPVSREQVHVVIHPSPPPATAPAPPEAPNEKSAPTNIHKVECWVFDKASSPTTSHTTGAFTKAEVIKWLKEPNLASTNSVKPAAGLRLLLREQKTSIEWPFEKSTFAAIQEALGMPATSSYLHLPKSGACGKYLGTPGHPGETPPILSSQITRRC